MKKKNREPNEAVVPRRLLVTDRAFARSAPSNRLAHLERWAEKYNKQNMERVIWLVTLVFFTPFFVIFLIISALLITELNFDTGAGGLIKDLALSVSGVIAGYWLAIRWSERHASKLAAESKRLALSNLDRSVALNIKLLDIAIETLNQHSAPSFRFDAASLNMSLGASLDFLDEKLASSIDWQRIQLEHLSAKLVALEGRYFDYSRSKLSGGPPAQTDALLMVYVEFCHSLLSHVDQTRKDFFTLQTELKK